MRKAIFILVIFNSLTVEAQNNNVEWLKIIPVNAYSSKQITEFEVDSNENVSISAKGQAWGSVDWYSSFYKINKQSNTILSFSVNQGYINTFSLSNNFIYTAGSNLTKRDLTGNILSQKDLTWVNNEKLLAESVKIYNGSVYTSFFYDLIKFDLNANQIWKVKVSDVGSVVPLKLKTSKNFIYMHSVFYNPSSSRILKYDTLGNLIWSVNPGIYITNFTLDKNDNCYVIGQTLSSSAIVKLDRNGQKLWTSYNDSMYFFNGMVHNDSLFVCGGTITAHMQDPTQDDRKSGYSVYSTQSGELHSSQFFNLFTGICSDEQFTHIWSNGKTTYIGGRYCSQGYTTFLLKLGTPPVADIKENEKNNGSLSIYPNPGGGLFHIAYTSTEKTSFQINIIDITGKNIYHSSQQVQGNFKKDIDLSKYSKGIYLIEVLDNNKRSTRKIVID